LLGPHKMATEIVSLKLQMEDCGSL
jgi:hypothetical protein